MFDAAFNSPYTPVCHDTEEGNFEMLRQTEEWKPIPELIGVYEISNLGRVRRIATFGSNPHPIFRELRPHKKPNGYLAFDLTQHQRRNRGYGHRLVWRAFRGDIPKGLEINHRNGIRDDNRLENLELVTRSDNMVHGHRTMGRKGTKLTEKEVPEILAFLAHGKYSQMAIAKLYGVSQATIGHIASGRNWKRIPRFPQS